MVPGAEAYLRERHHASGSSSRGSASAACPGSAPCCPAPISASPRARARRRASFTGLEEPPPISANVRRPRVRADRRRAWARSARARRSTIAASISARCSTTSSRRTRASLRHHDLRQGAVRRPGADHQPVLERERHQRFAPAPPGSTSRSARCSRCSSAASSSTRRSAPSPGEVAEPATSFPLYANKRALAQAQFTQKIPYPGLFRRLGPRPQPGRAGRVPRHHGGRGDQRRSSSSIRPPPRSASR